MNCIGCGSAAVTERSDLTAQGYRRFRCRECGKQFNERVAVPQSGVAAEQHHRLRGVCGALQADPAGSQRDHAAARVTVSHECVRQWEAKLLPVMGEALRKRRHGRGRSSGQSW